MIGCDVASALGIAAVAVPGTPLPVLLGLVFAVTLLASPFSAARFGLMRHVFPDDRYHAAGNATAVLNRVAYLLGFAAGGTVVAVLGPGLALLLDAGTFAASAALLRLTVTARLAPTPSADARPWWAEVTGGFRLLFGDPLLRRLIGYAWLCAAHVAPFGLAVPYAARHGGGAATVGWLLAANFAGTCLAVAVIHRVPIGRRLRLMAPLSILCCAALIPCGLNPGLWSTAGLWARSGVGGCYQVIANNAFGAAALPDTHRGKAFGAIVTGINAGQAVALLLTGALAEIIGPAAVLAGAGLLGTGAAVALAAGGLRAPDAA